MALHFITSFSFVFGHTTLLLSPIFKRIFVFVDFLFDFNFCLNIYYLQLDKFHSFILRLAKHRSYASSQYYIYLKEKAMVLVS